MNIGFDAKRLFHNSRGLGNYSRDTVRILSNHFPENQYFLFNPKPGNIAAFSLSENMTEINPDGIFYKLFPSLWRSKGLCSQITKSKLDIYHGLSQELPIGIEKTGTKTVVTMHDAIFIRYPELYSSSYRSVFIKKNKYTCKVADKIIAISEQTRRDFIDFFDVDPQKITVVYQGCNSVFRQPIAPSEIDRVRGKYNLPPQFLLNVGAIEKRKNAALIVEAMHMAKIEMPLVIIGNPTAYKQDIIETANKYRLSSQIIFLHNVSTSDLPAIYAQALVFLYPSLFEGFGIPILEALSVGVPVIASRGSCFEETGGKSALYIDPFNAEELGTAIKQVISDEQFRQKMIIDGKKYSENFTDEKIVQQLMDVYQSLF